MLIKTDRTIIQSYLEDSSGLTCGTAERVVIPSTTDEIAALLRDATRYNIPVTVSGAGTGVAGGRIPTAGTVLSLEAMTTRSDIRRLDDRQALVTVGAGVRVQDIKSIAASAGWFYPPDPTEQSSFIGGNVATNASGSRGFRYGSTRQYVRALTIVLPDGDILRLHRGRYRASVNRVITVPFENGERQLVLPAYRLPQIKNAAGYFNYPAMDLLDLFIGQEGTLGVITEVELLLVPALSRTVGGIAFFATMEAAWACAKEVKTSSYHARAGRTPAIIDALSLEYFDRNALALLREAYPGMPNGTAAALLFEQQVGSDQESIVIDAWATLLERYGVPAERVWFAAGLKEQDTFREFRHLLPEKVNEIVRRNGLPKVGTDMAVPFEHFDTMLAYYYELFEQQPLPYLVFGHIGDSHLHANILPSSEAEYVQARALYVRLAEKAVALGGTVSAEHGIGKTKHVFLEKMVGQDGIREMIALKKCFDKSFILGRGNLFPMPGA
jgi:D-lactate dehydrogenase (cytochrome)